MQTTVWSSLHGNSNLTVHHLSYFVRCHRHHLLLIHHHLIIETRQKDHPHPPLPAVCREKRSFTFGISISWIFDAFRELTNTIIRPKTIAFHCLIAQLRIRSLVCLAEQ